MDAAALPAQWLHKPRRLLGIPKMTETLLGNINYGSTLTIEQLEQQDENLPERMRRVWTSHVAVRDSAEADNYMKGLMRKKVLSLLAEKHVTVYRVCKDTGINRGRLYRWLNKENMSAISCRGVDKVLRYLDEVSDSSLN